MIDDRTRYGFGGIGKIFKGAAKAAKKIIKSPIGKAAVIGLGGYYLGGGFGAGGFKMGNIPGFTKFSGLSGMQKGVIGAGILGGVMGAKGAPEEEDDGPESYYRGPSYDDYIASRNRYDVLDDTKPMFSRAAQGGIANAGRIQAQQGMYANNPMMGQSMGMNPMGQMNPMAKAPITQMDPRQMQAQMMQGNARQGNSGQGPGIMSTPVAQEQDAELIQLIRALASLGIPMEQLRGRTKEELIQMAMSVQQGQGGSETVTEEETVTMNQGGRVPANMGMYTNNALMGQTMGQSMAPRTGYAIGSDYEDVVVEESEEEIKTPQGTMMEESETEMASYGPDDAMSETYDRFLEEKRKKNIPFDMEFDEFLELLRDAKAPGNPLPSDPTAPVNPFAPKPTGPVLPNKQAGVMVEDIQEDQTVAMDQGGLIDLAARAGLAMGSSQFGTLTSTPGVRTGMKMGTEMPVIPSKDGMQIDYRKTGGYQPHGKAEKHDDVRALLAQGEFVVTSDAVKGIGGGDRDLGAKRMYDMMHQYEPIGRATS
tara:strand:+ start:4348 stop:5958 length:1611 start_codon:yes stop_codon:yes gene_type:complete